MPRSDEVAKEMILDRLEVIDPTNLKVYKVDLIFKVFQWTVFSAGLRGVRKSCKQTKPAP